MTVRALQSKRQHFCSLWTKRILGKPLGKKFILIMNEKKIAKPRNLAAPQKVRNVNLIIKT